jgi:WD40 repeat protein/serine/threonine protein kinase
MQREARKIRSRAFFSIVEPANLKCGPAVGSIRCDTSSEGLGLPSLTSALGRCFSLMTRRAHTDGDLLLGMLALERGLIDQEQLLAAFSVWNAGEGRLMAEILVEQGSLDRADILRIANVLDENDPGLSATVAYLRSDLLEEHHARTETATSSARGLLESIDSVERFRILRPHARGGLGEVFLAVDAELDRQVALKELQAYHADDPQSQARFLREAQVTGRLEHPGIVPVYGLGRHADGRPYYAMRFIEGETLKRAIERFYGSHGAPRETGARELEFRRLLRSFIDACNAVAYAHSRGVVHRDLKPDNIMLGRFGETLVVDWGVAKLIAGAEDEPASSSGEGVPIDDLSLTRPGSAIGTPQYMSPEQASGDLSRVDQASDVYGLGATLYCVLVGHGPFPSGDVADVLHRVSRGIFPAPRRLRRSIDSKLEAICLKAMTVKPEDRHTTPLALAGEIEVWLAEVSYRSEQERALHEVKRSLARLSIERAQNLFTRDMPNEGMLWLARALENIPPDSPGIERAVRASLSGWYLRAKLMERTLSHGNAVHAVAFSPDGRMLATASADQMVRLWDVAKGGLLSAPIRHEKAVRAIAFSPDGRLVATASDDGAMRQWDAMTGAAVGSATSHGAPVTAVCFSPDGSRIATGSGSGGPSLWETATERRIGERAGHGAEVLAIAFHPDGTRLALACDDGAVRFRETEKGTLLVEVLNHDAAVAALAFSPDGRRLVSGCVDGRARLWETGGWTNLAEVPFCGKPGCLAYSPGGRSMATVSHDGTARLWDTETNRPIGEPLSHREPIDCLAFKGDGTMIATGSEDGTVRLWDADTGLPIGPSLAHHGAVRALAFNADNRRLATASQDGMARCWRVPAPIGGNVEQIACWVRVATELEFDEGDAIHRLDQSAVWDLRRRLQELGGAPVK